MEHFYKTIYGWFDFEIIYERMVQEAAMQAHFVEVGAFLGKSTSFMAVEINNSGKDIIFDVIDTWEGSVEHQAGAKHEQKLVQEGMLFPNFKLNMKPVAHLINPIQCTSLEGAQRYADRSLDFVFLDAAHDYDSVKADIKAWRPKIKPGGYIGGHDYQTLFMGVVEAVNEEFSVFETHYCSWLAKIE